MPRINFGELPEDLPQADNLNKVKILKSEQLKIAYDELDDLDKVKILKDDQLRVVFGAPLQPPVYITGTQGPVGPTGAAGGVQYFYGLTAPGNEAVTGDRWFHPGVGLEFTRIQGQWVQLYRNPQR